ncbi:MAG: hypothetical protein ACREF7_00565, partial [Candidatus Saccharimonadales bacterium]
MNNVYKSATIKLTAWYLLLVMAISLIASVVVYNSATGQLAKNMQAQTQRIFNEYPVFSGNPFFNRQSDLVTSSHHLLFTLLYFNLLVLIVAGFASYWLARLTL